MAKSFPTIALSRRDGESPVTEQLMQDYHDRDEALISQPIDTRFLEGSNNTNAFVPVRTLSLWIPPAVATTDGNVTLIVVFQAKVSAGTGRVRIKLGSGSYVETGNITNTTYQNYTLTISSTDLKAVANTETTLVFENKWTVSGTVYAKCDSCASRVERA